MRHQSTRHRPRDIVAPETLPGGPLDDRPAHIWTDLRPEECAEFEGAYAEPVGKDQPLRTGVTGNIISVRAAEFAELLKADEELEHGQMVVSASEAPEYLRI